MSFKLSISKYCSPLFNLYFRYPEYYKLIEKPIDLKIIASKIVDNKYTNLTELEEDFGLMCKNAQIFNEPGSQIYKDARIILKTVKNKKVELEAAKVARENRGTRSRSRGSNGGSANSGKKHYASEVRVFDRELCSKVLKETLLLLLFLFFLSKKCSKSNKKSS